MREKTLKKHKKYKKLKEKIKTTNYILKKTSLCTSTTTLHERENKKKIDKTKENH